MKKRMPLRVVADPYNPGNPNEVVDYRAAIRGIIRKPLDPQRGADIEEIRRGIRILDALDLAGTYLALEDEDWAHLQAKVAAMQWTMVDRRVLDFVDAINNPTDEATYEASTNHVVMAEITAEA